MPFVACPYCLNDSELLPDQTDDPVLRCRWCLSLVAQGTWLRVGGRRTQRVVVVLSASVAIAVAGWDISVTSQGAPPQPLRGPRPPEFSQLHLTLDFFLTLVGVACATGRLLYQWFGAEAEAEVLRRGQWFLLALNLVSGVWLIFGGWQALQNALVVRPSCIVGAILLGIATFDGCILLRARRTPPPVSQPVGGTRSADTHASDSPPPFPPSLAELVNLASWEAVNHGQAFVGPQHLLLALSRLRDRPTGQLLSAEGATAEKLREALAPLLAYTLTHPPRNGLWAVTSILRAMESAESMARACGSEVTEPEDLLLVLLADEEGVVVSTLRSLGVDTDRLAESLANRGRVSPPA